MVPQGRMPSAGRRRSRCLQSPFSQDATATLGQYSYYPVENHHSSVGIGYTIAGLGTLEIVAARLVYGCLDRKLYMSALLVTDGQAPRAGGELERRLEAQQLESLAILAGGVAHDFNNLLVAILGNASLLEARLPANSPLRPFVERIATAAERSADLAHHLLAYTGMGRVSPELSDLNQLVQEMAQLLESSISEKAVLELRLHEELPRLLVDVTQIRQVIMNLILNASDALGGAPGAITVSTGAIELRGGDLARFSPANAIAAGPYVALEVVDNGAGMDEETQARIFDPLFSTKPGGRGLGLASVLGIVRIHGGALAIDSRPGRGTRFQVVLPVRPAPTSLHVGAGEEHRP